MKKIITILFFGVLAMNGFCGQLDDAVTNKQYQCDDATNQNYFDGINLGTYNSTSSLDYYVYWQGQANNTGHFYYRIDGGTFTVISSDDVSSSGDYQVSPLSISLSSLSEGDHTFEVYFEIGGVLDNNYGQNYIANFKVTKTSTNNPTGCTASISSTTTTLNWINSGYNVMVVQYPHNVTPTIPTNGTTYSVGNTLGTNPNTGTVVYAGAGTSATATVSKNTDYDYYYYSVMASNTYSEGYKVIASKDKFRIVYLESGANDWLPINMNQNSNNDDQYDVNLTVNSLSSSCWIEWNNGGNGVPVYGGKSKSVYLNSLSNAHTGNVTVVAYKSSSANNWGANFPLGTNTPPNIIHPEVSYLNGNINAHFSGEARVELFTVSGKLVHSQNPLNQYSVPVNKGIYILKISTNKEATVHKLIVE